MWPPVCWHGDLGADRPDGDTPTHACGVVVLGCLPACLAPVASADHLVVADVAVVFFEKNIEKGQVEEGSFRSGIDYWWYGCD